MVGSRCILGQVQNDQDESKNMEMKNTRFIFSKYCFQFRNKIYNFADMFMVGNCNIDSSTV